MEVIHSQGVFIGRMGTTTVVTMSRVGDALLTERLERDLSQEAVGFLLGRSQSAIVRYEAGKPVPASIAPAVAKFLHVTLDEARAMIAETHEEPAPSRIRRSNAERLNDLETGIAELRAAVTELLRQPDGAERRGRRTPKP